MKSFNPHIAVAAPGPWVVIDTTTGKVKSEHKNKGEATKAYKKLNDGHFKAKPDSNEGRYEMKSKAYHEEMQPKKKTAAPYTPDSFGAQGDTDPYDSDPYNQRFAPKNEKPSYEEQYPDRVASTNVLSTKEASVKSHTAKNVEAQVKSAAPELTKLAKHRVALAYALASGNKTASTSTARRRMVEAFLTMPTFALQSLYDMHSASTHSAGEEEMPPVKDEAAPEGDMPVAEGDMPPAEGGEAAPEGDLGGGEGGDLGGMDLGGGGGGMMMPPGAPGFAM